MTKCGRCRDDARGEDARSHPRHRHPRPAHPARCAHTDPSSPHRDHLRSHRLSTFHRCDGVRGRAAARPGRHCRTADPPHSDGSALRQAAGQRVRALHGQLHRGGGRRCVLPPRTSDAVVSRHRHAGAAATQGLTTEVSRAAHHGVPVDSAAGAGGGAAHHLPDGAGDAAGDAAAEGVGEEGGQALSRSFGRRSSRTWTRGS